MAFLDTIYTFEKITLSCDISINNYNKIVLYFYFSLIQFTRKYKIAHTFTKFQIYGY